jgi:nicotinic acid mononucleotide adenylyltransferase
MGTSEQLGHPAEAAAPAEPSGDATRIEAVLVLGGAFNPVHTQHVALMSLVKRGIGTKHHYAISAGYLAVAPDGYVRAKLKDQAIKAEHRLAMCNLAMRGQDWLLPCDRTYGSALECGLRRRQRREVRILVALGADRAMGKSERAKWRRPAKEGIITVCIGRAGGSQRIQEHYSADLRASLVPDPQSFLFVTQEVGTVTSSVVRSELQDLHAVATSEEKRIAAQRLVEQGFLHASVAEYILEHERDL